MPQFTTASRSTAGSYAAGRSVSTAQLLGQVMFLVALAIAFAVVGSVVGRDLQFGTGRICSLVGFGMLLVASFGGERFRVGSFAIGWLFATALMIGLGLGPVLSVYTAADPSAVTSAIGGTALAVAAAGSVGFTMSKDLVSWMRPLSFVVLGLVLVSLGMLLFGAGGNPVVSGLIALVSTALILVDFNVLRKHGTERDVVMLATGIFVSIINIFVSLLNIFSR